MKLINYNIDLTTYQNLGSRNSGTVSRSLENAMKAAYIEKTGSVDHIIYGDLPKPKATGSQALVHVKAVSVNPIDTYIRSGGVAMELAAAVHHRLRPGRRGRCRRSGGHSG